MNDAQGISARVGSERRGSARATRVNLIRIKRKVVKNLPIPLVMDHSVSQPTQVNTSDYTYVFACTYIYICACTHLYGNLKFIYRLLLPTFTTFVVVKLNCITLH